MLICAGFSHQSPVECKDNFSNAQHSRCEEEMGYILEEHLSLFGGVGINFAGEHLIGEVG